MNNCDDVRVGACALPAKPRTLTESLSSNHAKNSFFWTSPFCVHALYINPIK